MLQNIRDNSQGWIAKAIIGLIIMLLAMTGVDAIFNASGSKRDVATVNDESITEDQLRQALDVQRNQLLQQLGAGFDASLLRDELLRGSVLNGIIDRVLLLQGAKEAGFTYSQVALDQVILQTPEFQIDGKFAASRFDQVIQRMGYTRLQFRQLLEQEMLIGQLRAGLAGTAFVTDQQVEAFVRLDKQTRDFSMQTVPVDLNSVQISDADISQYYTAHPERFHSPEQVVVDYLKLKKEQFFDQVSVDEQRVRELYEKQIASLAEQRHAAHILIDVGTELDEAQAKAKLEEIRARLDKGEDFAALAKSFSKDTGSATEGGDLGFAGPGVYDPAFEAALYGLKEGEVSGPVRSQFGWHLIKLLGVQAPEVPSFETLKPGLVRELKAEQVEQRFVEASKQLETAAYEAADLLSPAKELGLSVQTSAAFGREGGEGIAANRQVLQAAFSEQVLTDRANSSLIELDPETVIVLHLKEHRKPERQPLEQVKEQIVQQLKADKATEKARQDGEALLAKVRTEVYVPKLPAPEATPAPAAVSAPVAEAAVLATPEAVTEPKEKEEAVATPAPSEAPAVAATEPPQETPSVVAVEPAAVIPAAVGWKTLEAASRVQEGVDPAILQAVFRLPKPSKDKPSYGSVILKSGDFVVVRLEGVSQPDKALSEEQRQEYKRQLASRIGQQDFAAYMNARRAKAEIERF